jgi:uracil phosphoribosyltransferase
MVTDVQHQSLTFKLSEIEHRYGPRVHILSSPVALSLLAKLGHPATRQPDVNYLVRMLYDRLFDCAADTLFPKIESAVETRMRASHPEAVYRGEIIDPETPAVTVDLARAGTFPSHLCYEKLNHLLNPDRARQDHFYIARATDASGHVTGVTVSGSKIGGPVDDAVVLFPDPMGATGGTIVEVYRHYTERVGGKPRLLAALHLIVTPEYLRRVRAECPELHVFALRLDRGLSAPEVLREPPGLFWDRERGLNDHQYIVPGAGGLGEILNNSWC